MTDVAKKDIDADNLVDVLSEIETAFAEIPFGSSDFQIKNFIVNASITPERAYRTIGLQLIDKINALRSNQYTLGTQDLDIEEIKMQLEDVKYTTGMNEAEKTINRRRLKLDLAFKQNQRNFQNKLFNDSVRELNVLYGAFQKLPKYTREEFEAGEYGYYQENLTRQIQGFVGASEALLNMGIVRDKEGNRIAASDLYTDIVSGGVAKTKLEEDHRQKQIENDLYNAPPGSKYRG